MPSVFDYFSRSLDRPIAGAMRARSEGQQAAFDQEQAIRQQALRESLARQQQEDQRLDREQRASETAAQQGRFEAQLRQQREMADREREDRQAATMYERGVLPTPGGVTPFAVGPNKQQRENAERLTHEQALLELRNKMDVPSERDRYLQEQANRRDVSGPTTAQGGGGRMLPASMADNLGTFNALMATASDALDKLDTAVNAGVDATGPIRGRIAGTTVGRLLNIGQQPEGISARSAIANVTSSIMKERSGGAITPQEFVRLEPFLADKNKGEAEARQNLVDLYNALKSIKAERMAALEGSGYDVRGVAGDRAADGMRVPVKVTAQAPATTLSDADYYEQLRDEGVAHEEAVQQVRLRKKGGG